MGSLDEKISVVKAKPWLVSLVCAVFIAYPNLAWIFCDMSYLAPNDASQLVDGSEDYHRFCFHDEQGV